MLLRRAENNEIDEQFFIIQKFLNAERLAGKDREGKARERRQAYWRGESAGLHAHKQ